VAPDTVVQLVPVGPVAKLIGGPCHIQKVQDHYLQNCHK